MSIEWVDDLAVTWQGDDRLVRQVRVARSWILRVVSDRALRRDGGAAPITDFCAAFDDQFSIWVRPRGSPDPLGLRAAGSGADLEIVGDVTLGTPHDVSVVVKPGDSAQARWNCSCGVTSRGSTTPERARDAADRHALQAPDGMARMDDAAVAQGDGGAWLPRGIRVARRFHACVRSDLSVAQIHRRGHGEDFELVVDGQLGLWTRRLGTDSALRRDEDARGVSLLIMD